MASCDGRIGRMGRAARFLACPTMTVTEVPELGVELVLHRSAQTATAMYGTHIASSARIVMRTTQARDAAVLAIQQLISRTPTPARKGT